MSFMGRILKVGRDLQATGIALAQGSILVGNSSGLAAALSVKDTTKILVGNGTTVASVAVSGDATLANTGAITIATIAGAATAAEVNRACDVSARMVAVGATAAVAITSEGKIIRVGQDGAANTAVVLTLPEATGSGAIYRFIINTTNTGGLTIAALTTDTMVGIVNMLDMDGATQGAFQASGTDDKILLNSTDKGGQIGDWLEFIDYVDTKWAVKGSLTVPTGSNPADPFAAT